MAADRALGNPALYRLFKRSNTVKDNPLHFVAQPILDRIFIFPETACVSLFYVVIDETLIKGLRKLQLYGVKWISITLVKSSIIKRRLVRHGRLSVNPC